MVAGAAGGKVATLFYRPGHAAPTPCKVVFVGDSVMFAALSDGGGQINTRILSRGNYLFNQSAFGGLGPLDDARRNGQWLAAIQANNPDIVIYEGVGNYNIAGLGGPPGVLWNTPAYYSAWQTEVQNTLTALTATNGCRVGVVNVPPQTLDADHAVVADTLNGLYAQMVAGTSGCHLLDLRRVVGGDVYNANYRSDPIHLNAVGTQMFCQLMEDWITSGAPVP